MLINIEDIKIGEKIPVSFSETYKIPEEYGFFNSEATAFVDGYLQKRDDYFSFKAKVFTKAVSECALCLKPVEKPLEFKINIKFSETLDSLGLEDILRINSKEIDLSDAVLTSLLIEIPVKFICSKDCKGLCQYCGANLNEIECNCKKEHPESTSEGVRNERASEKFAAFKDFFKEV